jgi:hypothetical protein
VNVWARILYAGWPTFKGNSRTNVDLKDRWKNMHSKGEQLCDRCFLSLCDRCVLSLPSATPFVTDTTFSTEEEALCHMAASVDFAVTNEAIGEAACGTPALGGHETGDLNSL